METKEFVYTIAKQLGKGAGKAEKAVVKSKDWLATTALTRKLFVDYGDYSKFEFLEKKINDGELMVLSAAEVKDLFESR